METTDLRIKAKKISELDDITKSSDNIDFENSFIIIGYRNGTVGKNYKVPLSYIINEISSHNQGINESELKSKVQDLINANEIIFPILNGPQGPQGPQGQQGEGVDIDWDAVQQQINTLQALVNQYHNKYIIEYNLSYITANSTNVSSLLYDESVTLYFTPNNGYVMPNYISVIGANFDYDKDNKSIRIYNPSSTDHKIKINIAGDIGYYLVNYNLTNISYTYISTEKSSYQKDEIITIQLSANEGYKLPTSVLLTNATLISYDTVSGNLQFKVLGNGNINVDAIGEINSIYYFGFAADGYDGNDILEYNTNGYPNGNITINDKFYSNISCPIDYSHSYQFMENTAESYGEDNVWMILPSKYFDKSSKSFIDDNGNLYRLTGGNSGLNINIDIVIDGYINDINYVICLIANEGISDFINFIRK